MYVYQGPESNDVWNKRFWLTINLIHVLGQQISWKQAVILTCPSLYFEEQSYVNCSDTLTESCNHFK